MNEQHAETNASVVRQGFAGDEMQMQHDTAATAVAARAKAQIEARYVMAIKRPRSWDEVRTRLLKECKRPGFARAARYRKPVGQGIEGPSIRFAEAAIRYMTNVSIETTATYDDPKKIILRVSVVDLEANVPYEQDVAIAKTVERKKLGKGQVPLAQRTNSFGDPVFIVEATDDEILNKVNALVSKALRTLALRLLPGDILDECMDTCISTAKDEDAKDPDAARKALVSAFFDQGISAGAIIEYLGHPLDAVTPAEMSELRGIYAAIRDGEATWQEVMDHKRPSNGNGNGETPKTGAAKKIDEILEKQKEAKTKKGGTKAAAAETKGADRETKAAQDETTRAREPGEDG